MIFCSSLGYMHLLMNSYAKGGPHATPTMNSAKGKHEVLKSSIPMSTLFIKNMLQM